MQRPQRVVRGRKLLLAVVAVASGVTISCSVEAIGSFDSGWDAVFEAAAADAANDASSDSAIDTSDDAGDVMDATSD